MNYDNSPIVARSTPKGQGALAIIRCSGNNILDIVKKTFKTKHPIKHRHASFGQFYDNDNNLIDEVVLTYYKEPRSYTGEDLVEMNCHGSQYTINTIINILITNGARAAKPGEYTKRRFLNNKIDLTQAEGINKVIQTQTQAANDAAKTLLDGSFGKNIKKIKDDIIDIISILELELDFTEEEIDKQKPEKTKRQIQTVITTINDLIKSYKYGRLITQGLKIALIGPPNSGKSTLLNAIIKKERAITSSQAGTTRDYIKESIEHSGYKLTFIDTAGLRNSDKEIEKKGITKAQNIINDADLLITLLDPTQSPNKYRNLVHNDTKKTIYVLNKIDITSKSEQTNFLSQIDINNPVKISAKQKINIANLNDSIVEWLENKKPINTDNIVTVQRHYNILKNTKTELERAIQAIKNNYASEFVSTDLRHALNTLNEILGQTTNEDILSNIFNNFCIGK